MNEQDNAVESTPTETTVDTESAPVEQKTTEAQQEKATPEPSADTTVEPEKEVSKTVPYERFKKVNDQFKKVNDELKELKEQQSSTVVEGHGSIDEQVQQPVEKASSTFEPETEKALDSFVEQKFEKRKEAEFVARHKEELKDPVLAGTTQRIIAEENAKGKVIDQEDALAKAKALIEDRLSKPVNTAKKEGVEEGQELAKQKQQAGAVGDTSTKSDVKSDAELSAKELEDKYNIPRVN